MKWAKLYSSLNILQYCSSLGLEWKQTFSSLVACGKIFARCLCKTMRKNNRKQKQKLTRVHGLIGRGQSDLLEQMERRSADLGTLGQCKLECCLCMHWLFLWCSCRDLCSHPSGALCTEKNIAIQKKNINWGYDWEHGKLMFSKKRRYFLHSKSSTKAVWNQSVGLLTLNVLSPPVPSSLLFCLCFS